MVTKMFQPPQIGLCEFSSPYASSLSRPEFDFDEIRASPVCFNGQPVEDPTAFLKELRGYTTRYTVTDAEVLRQLPLRLRGTAREWLDSSPHFFSMAAFERAFLENFNSPRRQAIRERATYTLLQELEQPVALHPQVEKEALMSPAPKIASKDNVETQKSEKSKRKRKEKVQPRKRQKTSAEGETENSNNKGDEIQYDEEPMEIDEVIVTNDDSDSRGVRDIKPAEISSAKEETSAKERRDISSGTFKNEDLQGSGSGDSDKKIEKERSKSSPVNAQVSDAIEDETTNVKDASDRHVASKPVEIEKYNDAAHPPTALFAIDPSRHKSAKYKAACHQENSKDQVPSSFGCVETTTHQSRRQLNIEVSTAFSNTVLQFGTNVMPFCEVACPPTDVKKHVEMFCRTPRHMLRPPERLDFSIML